MVESLHLKNFRFDYLDIQLNEDVCALCDEDFHASSVGLFLDA